MTAVDANTAPRPASDVPGGSYPWIVTCILMLVYTAAFIDRQVLNLVVEPMKRSLLITDTQMSLLQGAAFTVAYVIFSPIMGRLADRANRRNVLLAAVCVWSLATAAGGMADSFWGFFASRVGVGAAEAAVTPIAWSMLTDYFSRERLPRAMSFFLIGPYVGAGLALIFGGLLIGVAQSIADAVPILAGREPWQIVFIVIGLPGLLLGALMLVVREPPRGAVGHGMTEAPSLAEVARYFWSGRAFFGRFYGGMAGIIIVLYALPAWTPALLMRRFSIDPRTVGLNYGTTVLVLGTVGVLTGPALGRWLARRGRDGASLRVAALAGLALIPASIALPLAPTYVMGLIAAGAATFFYSLPQAMAASALQLASPPLMRGVAAALYVFLVAVIGLGVAPTVVALLTDYVFRDTAMVGWSLGIVCTVSSAVGAWLISGAIPHYRAAVERAEAS